MSDLEERARALAPYLIALREAVESEEIKLLIAELLDILDEMDKDRMQSSDLPYSEDF